MAFIFLLPQGRFEIQKTFQKLKAQALRIMFPILFFLLTLCIRRKALGASFFICLLVVVYQPDYQIIILIARFQLNSYNDFFEMLTFAKISLRINQKTHQKENRHKPFLIQNFQNTSQVGLFSRSSRANSIKSKQKGPQKISDAKTNKYRTPVLKKFSDIKHSSTSTTQSKNQNNSIKITEFRLHEKKHQQANPMQKLVEKQESGTNRSRIRQNGEYFYEYLEKNVRKIQEMIEDIHKLIGKSRQKSGKCKKLSFGMIKSLYGKNSALCQLMNLHRKLLVFETEMKQSIGNSVTEKQDLNFENLVKLLSQALEIGQKIVEDYKEDLKNEELVLKIPTKKQTLPLQYYTDRERTIVRKQQTFNTELPPSKTQCIPKYLKTH